uniref:Uncharacterized protein n=1 Tax=Setaria italica TaxID=4555 RepID=K3YJ58_SETIT
MTWVLHARMQIIQDLHDDTDDEGGLACLRRYGTDAELGLLLSDLRLIDEGDLAHDVRPQGVAEERVWGDLQAWVGAAVRVDRDGGRVADVDLEVQQALREHEEVALVQRLGVGRVGLGADEADGDGSLDDEDELGAFRVGVEGHDSADADVDARGADAEPVQARDLLDVGRGQASVEGGEDRAGSGEVVGVEVVGVDESLGLARVAGRRVWEEQVGDAEVLGQSEGGEGKKQQGEQGHEHEVEHGGLGRHGYRPGYLTARVGVSR